MTAFFTRETFFRPAEVSRHASSLPAALYNGLRLLVTRSEGDCLFIALRGLQYQAVVTREEIIFVDSQGGYAHRDGVGGRIIRIAWQPQHLVPRSSLSDPVPCDLVFYARGLKELQWRLMSEIRPAVEQLLQRQRPLPMTEGTIVPINP